MSKRATVLLAFALVVAATGALTTGVTAQSNEKITICHATGSDSNPYVMITISINGLNGHQHHDDIIPAPAGGCPTTITTTTDTATVDESVTVNESVTVVLRNAGFTIIDATTAELDGVRFIVVPVADSVAVLSTVPEGTTVFRIADVFLVQEPGVTVPTATQDSLVERLGEPMPSEQVLQGVSQGPGPASTGSAGVLGDSNQAGVTAALAFALLLPVSMLAIRGRMHRT